MSRSDAERISDILSACTELKAIVGKGRAEFERNSVLRRAAERLLEIIGEAAGAVSTEVAEAHPSLPFAKARAMRNLLSHEYWLSNPGIIWGTIERDIPEFASQLDALHDALTQPPRTAILQQVSPPRPPRTGSSTPTPQASGRRRPRSRQPRCSKWMPRAKRHCTRPKGHRGRCR